MTETTEDRKFIKKWTKIDLPTVPSALIRVALKDLEACEKDPKYSICMADWHSPDPESGMCYVCFAGSVIAKSLKSSPADMREPADFFSYGDGLPNKDLRGPLEALEAFRTGQIAHGLYRMGVVPSKPVKFEITVPFAYEENPEAFKATMRELADYLESQDL